MVSYIESWAEFSAMKSDFSLGQGRFMYPKNIKNNNNGLIVEGTSQNHGIGETLMRKPQHPILVITFVSWLLLVHGICSCAAQLTLVISF